MERARAVAEPNPAAENILQVTDTGTITSTVPAPRDMLTARAKDHAVAGEIFPHATDSALFSFTLPHTMSDTKEHKVITALVKFFFFSYLFSP
jgi:hypothetical protein